MTAILKVRDKTTGEFVGIPAIKGDTGATPDIELSVAMLDEGSEPTVDKSGTAENPSITLGIPKGEKGDKGDRGNAFTFGDFTSEQIEQLQQPAVDAGNDAVSIAEDAVTRADNATNEALAIVERNDKMLPLGSIAWMLVDTTPDGYEPLWDGHTITRAQYPDFFSRLVDNNNLPIATESSYTEVIRTASSCPRFVKVDANTLRLPTLNTLLKAGGELGIISVNALSNITSNFNLQSFIARPFLKCADVSRTLTEEQTSEIRNLYANKANADLGNATLIKNLSANGYYKAPDGLMMQWGYSPGGDYTVYFPVSFMGQPFSCMVLPYSPGLAMISTASHVALTSTYFSYRTQWHNLDALGVMASNEKAYWLVIGRWK